MNHLSKVPTIFTVLGIVFLIVFASFTYDTHQDDITSTTKAILNTPLQTITLKGSRGKANTTRTLNIEFHEIYKKGLKYYLVGKVRGDEHSLVTLVLFRGQYAGKATTFHKDNASVKRYHFKHFDSFTKDHNQNRLSTLYNQLKNDNTLKIKGYQLSSEVLSQGNLPLVLERRLNLNGRADENVTREAKKIKFLANLPHDITLPTMVGEPYIDVLLLYNQSAIDATLRQSANDLRLEMEHAALETNAIYARSGVNQRINVVKMQKVEYPENGIYRIDLAKLSKKDNPLGRKAHELREKHGADLVSLWLGTNKADSRNDNRKEVGKANKLNLLSFKRQSAAFSIVKYQDGINKFTFPHELGHNMGLWHDSPQDTRNKPFIEGHGHNYASLSDKNRKWRTVMSYKCGSNCNRIPYFSNPNRKFAGMPLGTTPSTMNGGDKHPADNRTVLNRTARTIANYRGATPKLSAIVKGNIIYLTYRAQDGLLYINTVNTKFPNQTPRQWKRARVKGGITGTPTMTTLGEGVSVFVRGINGKIYGADLVGKNDTRGWRLSSNLLWNSSIAVTRFQNKNYVFAIDAVGSLYFKSANALNFGQNWTLIAKNQRLAAPQIFNDTKHMPMSMVNRDKNNIIVVRDFVNGTWKEQKLYGNSENIDPTIVIKPSDRSKHVFGGDGAVFYKVHKNGQWSPSGNKWTNIGGNNNGRIAAVRLLNRQIHLFSTTKNFRIQHKILDHNGQWKPSIRTWNTIVPDPITGSAPVAVTVNNEIFLFFVSDRGGVYLKKWKNGRWANKVTIGGAVD